ncbi:fluoride efflux transporter CrcB [Bacillus sp. CGMCC 1.16541]|uniref:fluoride efflux transporter CrcB n=1 Tax=Bacillus sp. CGMCC 1.16541 TaxID=2185143 RepID=UPI00194FF950|nr:fluoride efflux transporter CrcB [Bacillus sp. CGMCC 1.16541]
MYVVLGGSIGAVFRYFLGLVVMKQYSNPPFPVAMLVVNIIGSGGLGFFYGYYYGGVPNGLVYEQPLFLIMAIGFFGAFTTFSTFSMEVVTLIERKRYKELAAYISFSLIGAFTLFSIALFIGKEMFF